MPAPEITNLSYLRSLTVNQETVYEKPFQSVIVAASAIMLLTLVSCKQKKNVYYSPREITCATDVPKYDLKLNHIDLECFGVHDIIAVDSMIVAHNQR